MDSLKFERGKLPSGLLYDLLRLENLTKIERGINGELKTNPDASELFEILRRLTGEVAIPGLFLLLSFYLCSTGEAQSIQDAFQAIKTVNENITQIPPNAFEQIARYLWWIVGLGAVGGSVIIGFRYIPLIWRDILYRLGRSQQGLSLEEQAELRSLSRMGRRGFGITLAAAILLSGLGKVWRNLQEFIFPPLVATKAERVASAFEKIEGAEMQILTSEPGHKLMRAIIMAKNQAITNLNELINMLGQLQIEAEVKTQLLKISSGLLDVEKKLKNIEAQKILLEKINPEKLANILAYYENLKQTIDELKNALKTKNSEMIQKSFQKLLEILQQLDKDLSEIIGK